MSDSGGASVRMSALQYIRYGAEAAFFFLLIGLFRLLTTDAASALGGFMGRAIFSLTPLTARARANLRAAYPDKSDADLDPVVHEMWDNLGRTVAEYAHLDSFLIGGTNPRLEIEGLEHLDAAEGGGKSLILVSGHFANWEALPIAAAQCGVEGGAVYRPINNPFVDRWIVGQRLKYGPKDQIAKGASGTRRIFTLLRARKAIFLLVDQKTNEGLAVPFFGRDAMTTPVPAALALKLDAVLVPVSNERLHGPHFRVTIHPPIAFAPSGDHHRDVLALTSLINAEIERFVRAHPSQWLWIHRRWPKLGESPRTRRGREAQALAGAGVRVERDGSSLT